MENYVKFACSYLTEEFFDLWTDWYPKPLVYIKISDWYYKPLTDISYLLLLSKTSDWYHKHLTENSNLWLIYKTSNNPKFWLIQHSEWHPETLSDHFYNFVHFVMMSYESNINSSTPQHEFMNSNSKLNKRNVVGSS